VLALLIAAFGAWQWWSEQRVPPPAAESEPRASNNRPTFTRDLGIDERNGGHTLARHVGLTDTSLRARLRGERDISAASTYTDRATAEEIVGTTLATQSDRLNPWLAREGNRPNLALTYRGPPGRVIGRSLRRDARSAVDCTDAVVVLRWDRERFYVLTSYPEARR
jgi:hypothetical protein